MLRLSQKYGVYKNKIFSWMEKIKTKYKQC